MSWLRRIYYGTTLLLYVPTLRHDWWCHYREEFVTVVYIDTIAVITVIWVLPLWTLHWYVWFEFAIRWYLLLSLYFPLFGDSGGGGWFACYVYFVHYCVRYVTDGCLLTFCWEFVRSFYRYSVMRAVGGDGAGLQYDWCCSWPFVRYGSPVMPGCCVIFDCCRLLLRCNSVEPVILPLPLLTIWWCGWSVFWRLPIAIRCLYVIYCYGTAFWSPTCCWFCSLLPRYWPAVQVFFWCSLWPVLNAIAFSDLDTYIRYSCCGEHLVVRCCYCSTLLTTVVPVHYGILYDLFDEYNFVDLDCSSVGNSVVDGVDDLHYHSLSGGIPDFGRVFGVGPFWVDSVDFLPGYSISDYGCCYSFGDCCWWWYDVAIPIILLMLVFTLTCSFGCCIERELLTVMTSPLLVLYGVIRLYLFSDDLVHLFVIDGGGGGGDPPLIIRLMWPVRWWEGDCYLHWRYWLSLLCCYRYRGDALPFVRCHLVRCLVTLPLSTVFFTLRCDYLADRWHCPLLLPLIAGGVVGWFLASTLFTVVAFLLPGISCYHLFCSVVLWWTAVTITGPLVLVINTNAVVDSSFPITDYRCPLRCSVIFRLFRSLHAAAILELLRSVWHFLPHGGVRLFCSVVCWCLCCYSRNEDLRWSLPILRSDWLSALPCSTIRYDSQPLVRRIPFICSVLLLFTIRGILFVLPLEISPFHFPTVVDLEVISLLPLRWFPTVAAGTPLRRLLMLIDGVACHFRYRLSTTPFRLPRSTCHITCGWFGIRYHYLLPPLRLPIALWWERFISSVVGAVVTGRCDVLFIQLFVILWFDQWRGWRWWLLLLLLPGYDYAWWYYRYWFAVILIFCWYRCSDYCSLPLLLCGDVDCCCITFDDIFYRAGAVPCCLFDVGWITEFIRLLLLWLVVEGTLVVLWYLFVTLLTLPAFLYILNYWVFDSLLLDYSIILLTTLVILFCYWLEFWIHDTDACRYVRFCILTLHYSFARYCCI